MADLSQEHDSPAVHPALRLRDVSKSFPGVRALDRVTLDIHAGEVHVLLGENGAGKSTLVNIVAGTLEQDEGELEFGAEDSRVQARVYGRRPGVSIVFQEGSLVPLLSVAANIFLAQELSSKSVLRERSMRRRASETLDRLGYDIDPDALVRDLSRAQQQMVEIAKALQGDARILILDEPTATLTDSEAKKLFDLLLRLKRQGLAIVYITHRLGEVAGIGDRVSVLRDGRLIATKTVADTDEQRLIELMTGRPLTTLYPEINHAPREVAIRLSDASGRGGEFHDVTVEVRCGEVVGIGGLVGCGKSSVARALFGDFPLAAGTLAVHGQRVSRPSPRVMLRHGVAYLPPDRRELGLALGRPVRENMTLSSITADSVSRWGVIRGRNEATVCRETARRLDLRPPDVERRVGLFSGGNQQKVLFARALLRDASVIVMEEPTVGVDVGIRSQFYELIRDLCEGGAAILLVSSDLPEILYLCNRAYIMAGGRVTAHLLGDELTEAQALAGFFAGAPDGDTNEE
jgi:ribose transport system ATP-binding protein